jgi:hypothetical protein
MHLRGQILMEVDEFLHTLKYIAFFEGILTLPSDVHI